MIFLQRTFYSPGASPSSYILVPFDDPGCGPATRTTDPEDFLEIVNDLSLVGGGDWPEMFWCGLKEAIITAPMFSDIICFTDDVGKDGQLLPTVKAIANEKHSKVRDTVSFIFTLTQVTIIYSGDVKDSYDLGRTHSNNIVTTVEDYREICTLTGGLFVPLDKVS